MLFISLSCHNELNKSELINTDISHVSELIDRAISTDVYKDEFPPQMLITPSSSLPYIKYVDKDSIEYNLCYCANQKVCYISTWDTNFRMNGLTCLNKYSDVRKDLIAKEYFWNGWGHIIELKNGWNMSFADSAVINNQGVKPSSQISGFYLQKNQGE